MRLYGRYNSPYVRRGAVTMRLYAIDYEHENVIPFGEEKHDVARVNPITRVPALELPDGECIVDSTAIIDYLDEIAGPEVTLTPRGGLERRQVLKFIAIQLGIMDKLVAVLYERQFRPKKKWHRPWIDACEDHIRDGFYWINNKTKGDWLVGERMTQADVTLAVFWEFAVRIRPHFFADIKCNNIDTLTEKMHSLSAFKKTGAVEEALSAKLSTHPGEEIVQ